MGSGSQIASGAVSGAAAGAALGPYGTLGGAVLGGVMGSMSADPAEAAAQAAKEQQAKADAWKQDVQKNEDQALSLIGTPQQMAAYGQSLQAQEANVSRQEQVASQLNPALLESGKQLNDLLQGKSAPAIQNLNNQRQLQRQQMVDTLNQQSPGFASSAAGMKQLAAFDAQTSQLTTQTNAAYMDQIKDIPLEGSQMGNAISAANERLSNIQTQSPDAQKAKLIEGFTQLESPAQQMGVAAAGREQIGPILGAQQNASTLSNLATAAPQIAGAFKSNSAPKVDNSLMTQSPGSNTLGQNFSDFGNMTPNVPSSVAGGFAGGGVIPGMAKHPGKNTLANDTTTIHATPGEGVIPLKSMKNKKAAHKFVDKMFAQGGRVKANYDDGGKVTVPSAEDAKKMQSVYGQPSAPASSSTLESLADSVDNWFSGDKGKTKSAGGAGYYKGGKVRPDPKNPRGIINHHESIRRKIA